MSQGQVTLNLIATKTRTPAANIFQPCQGVPHYQGDISGQNLRGQDEWCVCLLRTLLQYTVSP